MAKINLKNAHLHYFKPVISKRHSLSWKWLLDSGYTVGYLSLCLGIRVEKLSGYFREPNRFTLQQIQIIIVLLRGIKEPNEVVKSLLVPIDSKDTQLNESLKTVYETIVLPVPTRTVPVHRLDYEPKVVKDKGKG